jgi:hypothetical protein
METSTLASVSTLVARKEDDPLVWNRPTITFVSTCPQCSHERPQQGYTRRMLFDLLNRRCKIDAYCFDCNVCWPISESERRAISPQLSPALQSCAGARSAWCSQRRRPRDAKRRDHENPSEGLLALRQALLTLRAIRLRYEIDRRHSDTRMPSVLVALSCADMLWISATIEALEETIAAGPLAGSDSASD